MTDSAVRRRVPGYAYPWDVVGDPGFADRVRALGIGQVSLPAHYHSVRASTPQHPRHQVVTAAHAASYRPVRSEAWRGRRLRPSDAAAWMGSSDSFDVAVAALREDGLTVDAWIVLNHSTRIGEANPDVSVVNCFGDRYPYALCPQHAEVRDFSATLAAESLRDVDVDGVVLEAWGQLGVGHAGHHDKTAGAWSPIAALLLSVCCCRACRSAWTSRGLEAERVVQALRDAVRAERGQARDADLDDLLPEGLAAALLATRHHAMAASLGSVLDAVAQTAPGVRVNAEAFPGEWATSPLAAVLSSAAGRVASVLVPVWPTTAESGDAIAATRAQAPSDIAVAAYVTVLPPADVADLDRHVHRIIAAGADELHLYHLGLADSKRQRAIATLASAFERGGIGRAC